MTILLVQTFLLMLGAFLLGASLACLIRRGFSGDSAGEGGTASTSGLSAASAAGVAAAADTDRFGRALSGGHGPSVPPVFQPGQPVVEVQPHPTSSPPEPVSFQSEPAPQPAPVPAPPQRDVLPPEPAAESAPEPGAPAPAPEGDGESYAQIAVAAAAAAAALKEKADAEAAAAAAAALKEKADAEAAAAAAAQEAEEAQPEPGSAAPETGASDQPSYTEIAAAAAAAATAAAAAALKADTGPEDEPTDAGPSRFGTDVEPATFAYTADQPVDDLTRIHGIDVALKERLVRYGVHRFSQIAAWTPDDVRGVNQSLGVQGRIERENWVEQARILAAGGDPGPAYELAPREPVETAVPVDGDRLHRIIGIDPQSEALLRANGVTQLAQIAAWSAADVEHFEGLLGIAGRVTREGWVEQARFLIGEAPPPAEDAFEAPPAVSEPEAESEAAAPRSESYAALRSVRSEALRGDAPAVATVGAVDDLKRIRGIGVLIEKKLNSLGITSYDQVANWTRADIDRVSELLDFKGRIERENWIEQARILASGGQTEFSRRADRGDA